MPGTQSQLDQLNQLTQQLTDEKSGTEQQAKTTADNQLTQKMADRLAALRDETQQLKSRTGTRHRYAQHRRKSKLDRAAAELLELYSQGASITELQRYLKQDRHITAHWTTIRNWLQQRDVYREAVSHAENSENA